MIVRYYNDLVPGRARGDPCSSDEAFLFHDPSIREAPEQWMNRRPSRTLYPTVPDADRHAPGLPLSDMQTDSTTPDDFKPPETHSWSTFSEEAAPYFKRLFQGAEDEVIDAHMICLKNTPLTQVHKAINERRLPTLQGDSKSETEVGQRSERDLKYRSSDAEYFQGDIGSRSEADEDTDIGVPVNKTRLRELEHMSLQARLCEVEEGNRLTSN
eukprot:jgi/Bigna1/67592/fgenesh1_pg.4_\